MSLIEQFHGAAADGTELTAIYAEQPAADVAFALIFAGHGLPRFVHWGRPLAAPGTVLAAYDALRPQRVSGALDETAWPSIMPTQSESWIGAPRLDIRRAGVAPFCAFTVTGIAIRQDERQGVDVSDGVDGAAHTVTQQVPVVTVTASDTEQGVELSWTAGTVARRTDQTARHAA